jgi:hypothetical protein
MSVAPDRAPFGRPAIPIDIAALSYHWSALKITRLLFFFSGLARDSDFLALVDLEVLLFDILPPATPFTPACILAGPPSWSQRGGKEARKEASSRPGHNHLIFK